MNPFLLRPQVFVLFFIVFFFFKQKTAYEIGTGDWSSDVCSSDLRTISNHGFINAYCPLINNGQITIGGVYHATII